MTSVKPWALGWLADREYLIQLAMRLNLADEPDASDEIDLEFAAVDYVVGKLWWPNLMQCSVDGSTELVFAVYVDSKRRPYPPRQIPRSELLSRKWADKLNELMPLKGNAQWYECIDGSYTPWRYPSSDDDLDESEVWIDVSHTLPKCDLDSATASAHEGAEHGELDEEDLVYDGHEESVGYDDEQGQAYYEEDGVDWVSEGGEYNEQSMEYAVEDTEYVGEERTAYDEDDGDSITVIGDGDHEHDTVGNTIKSRSIDGDNDVIPSGVDSVHGDANQAPPSGSTQDFSAEATADISGSLSSQFGLVTL